MARVRKSWIRHGKLCALLALVTLGSAVVSGCGSGGGGSSNGGLCEQCGDTDGPCQPSVTVSGNNATALCSGQPSCDVALACFRELDSAQRRCFPAAPEFERFECDGHRHRGTPTPVATVTPIPSATPTAISTQVTATPTSLTPTPTVTPTLTVTPGPNPTATPVCGNGVLEEGEECDGSNVNPDCLADDDVCTCEDFCSDAGGTLSCNANCTFNFSQCAVPPCEFQ